MFNEKHTCPACPRWGWVQTTPVVAAAIEKPLASSCSKNKRETWKSKYIQISQSHRACIRHYFSCWLPSFVHSCCCNIFVRPPLAWKHMPLQWGAGPAMWWKRPQGPVGQSSPWGQNNPRQGLWMAVAFSRADLYTMILQHRISVQQASFCSRLILNFRVFWQYECGQEKLLGPTADKIWEPGLHPLCWVVSFFQAKATRTMSSNSFLWVTGRWRTSQQRNYQSHFMEKCYFVQATFHKASIRKALGPETETAKWNCRCAITILAGGGRIRFELLLPLIHRHQRREWHVPGSGISHTRTTASQWQTAAHTLLSTFSQRNAEQKQILKPQQFPQKRFTVLQALRNCVSLCDRGWPGWQTMLGQADR